MVQIKDVDISMYVDDPNEAQLITAMLPKLLDKYSITTNNGGSRDAFIAFVGGTGKSFIGLCPTEGHYLSFNGDREQFFAKQRGIDYKFIDVPMIKANANGLCLRLEDNFFKLCFNYISPKNMPGEKANF